MKRVLVFALLALMCSVLSAAVAPVSSTIGKVSLSPERGSAEYLVWSAVRREYSDDWLERYTSSPVPFALAYSSALSPLLPLDNYLVSEENEGEVRVLDMESGSVITFIIKEGSITALRIED